MKRFLREYGIFGFLVLVKLLTTARTALDTYILTRDWLDVALIDAVFLGLWLTAAYAGQGDQVIRLRRFAFWGAALMYTAMVAVGIEAHQNAIAILVRFGGGLALAYDGWAYIQDARAAAKRAQQTPQQKFAQARHKAWNSAYWTALQLHRLSMVLPAWRVLVQDLQADMEQWSDDRYRVDVTPVQLAQPAIEQGVHVEQAAIQPVHSTAQGTIQPVITPVQTMRMVYTAGMSQVNMAKLTGLSRNTVRKYWHEITGKDQQ